MSGDDRRPRVNYTMAGRAAPIPIIFDHGERIPVETTFSDEAGKTHVVTLATEVYGVICEQPSGHRTVISHLTFSTLKQAQAAARRRNRLPQAIALSFLHHSARVAENRHSFAPSDRYLEVAQ